MSHLKCGKSNRIFYLKTSQVFSFSISLSNNSEIRRLILRMSKHKLQTNMTVYRRLHSGKPLDAVRSQEDPILFHRVLALLR